MKYPNVEVELIGNDGNAFYILGKTMKALRKAGVAENRIKEYQAEATSGSYDNLLQVTMEWVNVI